MERLTKIDDAGRNFIEVKKFCKDDDWIISEKADGITIRFHSKAIDKLAAFEDFMQEQGFEDLEHLDMRLKNLAYGAKYYACWENLKEYVADNLEITQVCQDPIEQEEYWCLTGTENCYKNLQDKIQELELADLIRRKEK